VLRKTTSTSKSNSSRGKQPVKLKIPFSKYDRVLLVGEGDFSFSLSLAKHHKVGSLLATSYDNEQSLIQKYPNVQRALDSLQNAKRTPHHGAEEHDTVDNKQGEKWNGFPNNNEGDERRSDEEKIISPKIDILHGIDATALSKKHKRLLDPHAPFTKIVFNFPHTGGLSTDVNRQVRANQELLVGFFNVAKQYLATQARPAKALPNDADDEIEYDSEGQEVVANSSPLALSSGQILVTLFEGEPYTLWNIRDLARHCGLQVTESFKFPWAAYPGYKHARTIGDITTGKDRAEEGKRKGAWRGEERDARCYVLALREEAHAAHATGKKRKRRSEGDDSD